jgi:hypothetical protein
MGRKQWGWKLAASVMKRRSRISNTRPIAAFTYQKRKEKYLIANPVTAKAVSIWKWAEA